MSCFATLMISWKVNNYLENIAAPKIVDNITAAFFYIVFKPFNHMRMRAIAYKKFEFGKLFFYVM